MPCRFKECQTQRLHGQGLCNRHRKWVEKGYFDKNLVQLKPMKLRIIRKGCKVSECLRKHRRNGFCERHDSAFKRGTMNKHGEVIKPLIRYSRDFPCIKCGKTGKITKGFCKSHYAQYRRGLIGFDGTIKRDRKRFRSYKDMVCQLCKKQKPRIRGKCESCYNMIKRGSMTETGRRIIPAILKNKGKKCNKDGCEEQAKIKLLCRTHYYEKYKSPPKVMINKGKQCSIIACKGNAHCKGLCVKHYSRRKIKNRMKANALKDTMTLSQQDIKNA